LVSRLPRSHTPLIFSIELGESFLPQSGRCQPLTDLLFSFKKILSSPFVVLLPSSSLLSLRVCLRIRESAEKFSAIWCYGFAAIRFPETNQYLILPFSVNLMPPTASAHSPLLFFPLKPILDDFLIVIHPTFFPRILTLGLASTLYGHFPPRRAFSEYRDLSLEIAPFGTFPSPFQKLYPA